MSSIPIALALVWKGPFLLIAQRRKDTHLGGFWNPARRSSGVAKVQFRESCCPTGFEATIIVIGAAMLV